jgi:hypothetical protein
MKLGDHPEFFRFPAPEGRSRESTIRLDGEGQLWHEGQPVAHPKLAQAMHGWISRHPDDGRFILTNGYDWTYFTVEDAPFFVRSVHIDDAGGVKLRLSDETEEAWDPATSRIGPCDALYAVVKRAHSQGPFEAKFTRFAQAQLAPVLIESEGSPGVRIGGRVVRIGG